MSVRNEPNNTANATATAASLGVPMTPALVETPGAAATAGASIADEHALAEANTFNTNNVDHPLSRSVVVNIRASLNDLCLKKSKATWSPSTEAVRNILQQRRFTDLTGASESQGDLKESDCISLKPPLANTLTLSGSQFHRALGAQSVVLHKLAIDQQSNSFPIAVGTKVVGVEDNTYSLTGEAFSSVALPETAVTTAKTLQEDDVTLGAPQNAFTHLVPNLMLTQSRHFQNPRVHSLRIREEISRGKLPLQTFPMRTLPVVLAFCAYALPSL